ncbi:leucyl/phenylalanyl-tRNA--protein transferase [Marivivens donghaensis]|uniref:leucyl/phenylalanyl-tRNA--protein transferase n=1 Tax=Marivivens donghaensis TaxID=1699413 RepID=UPI00201F7E5D|nr:leucyl/phenylalanyl-tRNA--protein transferase [Marivivens donghaensis]MCL7408212.1 leucyl/phenylalanyl-tRNA--protein transferase [Marivivens donghaensis]MDN3705017.1 leucyl/phenylalanyl-tRNA--protein transferase [Marivivens donghaensis]
MRDEAPALTPELLLNAYASGVFPMSESRDDPEVFWVDPRFRGIIPIGGFHISRSLAKRMRRGGFRVSFDTAFEQVVEGCADRDETWISDTIFALYSALYKAGFAHSVEVWEGDTLIGGSYGVALGGAYFGESMFSRHTDASKIALAWLIDRLRLDGFTLFDTQFLTPHLASLGGIEIPRGEYRKRLKAALAEPARFNAEAPIERAYSVIQRSTQTS